MSKNPSPLNPPTTNSAEPARQQDATSSSNNGSGLGASPAITLPKGGGAIKGIGEKFAANPVTGTGSITVPIATSPGRSGFGPQLSLTYDSGAGNGPFGLGWSLSLPTITRKTDKGLPTYSDAVESDVYILSGSEDLVPVLESDGERFEDVTVPGVTIHRYRPRIEGLFARIERHTNQTTGEIHWRSISRENVTNLYGKTAESCIADPNDPKRIFSWLVCESYDDKGNAIIYEYAAENDVNVDLGLVNERNRLRTANRYLKRIKYGNRISRLIEPDLTQATWMFQVVFDYDEDHYEQLDLDPSLPAAEQHQLVRASALSAPVDVWSVRPDPFSSYRSGFEVRTYRRCRRVLVFHRFDELGTEPYLVRSTEFDYADFDYSQPGTIESELSHKGSTRFSSFIHSITQSGFVRDDNQPIVDKNGIAYITYLKKSFPPLEFEYSRATIQDEIRELDLESLDNLPAGFSDSSYHWVDLDGEGVSGILAEQANAWFYKPNLGDGQFGPLETVLTKPSLADLRGGLQQLLDLSGDGQLDLVTFAGPSPGFYERTQEENWEQFKTFPHLPSIPWDEPNLRFVDLNGDGHADILITEDEVFTWYPSLAEGGFDSARSARKPLDEEKGPRLVLADATGSTYLADMSGHGLTDLVRIRNGDICYWPNLGYGRFGSKVAMDNAPWFDNPDQFDSQRIRLTDIDGSGVNDIIYLARDGVRLYFNQSGNRWSGPRRLTQTPQTDNLSSVMTVDLLGNGTACLVWSSPLPSHSRQPMLYIDLMGAKPHLLIKSVNNLGAETHIQYVASTKFYLADKLNGRPWITKVPFPVHVVERFETYDRISRNRFVTRFAYHHGYFDGVEREFRGFGMVEEWDTENFAALNENQQFPSSSNIDESSHIPPVLTRTWFHTGAYLGRDHVSDFFAGLSDEDDLGEYYREPGLTDAQARELLLNDSVLPTGLTIEEERECCRALKGSMLRQEVYALDGTDKEQHPYTVTEQNFTVQQLQPKAGNRHAVFFSHTRESITYDYERNQADPRISHALTLEVDKFGNVLKEAAVNYGRRETILVINQQGQTEEIPNPGLEQLSPLDQSTQTTTLITYTDGDFTNSISGDDDYRAPLSCDTRTYELTGLSPAGTRFTLDELLDGASAAAPIAYEIVPTSGLQQKRLIEQVRTLYRSNDLSTALPLGQVQSMALPFETQRMAFTPGLLAESYGDRVTSSMLETEGRYVHSEGDVNWWIPSDRIFYSPGTADTPPQELAHARAHFFLPHRYRDPFHTSSLNSESFVTYDSYDYLRLEITNALDSRVTVGERDANGSLISQGNDYRVLQPRLLMDYNRNRRTVVFDALGMVVGLAVMGKPEDNPQKGDQLEATFRANLTQAEIDQFFANPKGPLTLSLLGSATSRIIYDLTCYWRESDTQKKPPIFAASLLRESHASDVAPADGLKVQVSFSYSDGFGRVLQEKVQAAPGPVPKRDPVTGLVITINGQPEMTAEDVSPRWVGTGWTVFNNKGQPVRQYEPFFTDLHRFEFDVRIGVSPILFYDPVERLVGTLRPNHTWEKVVFDAWQQASWDVNDTVLIADPSTDLDVGDFFSRLLPTEYLPTWHAQRKAGALGPHEQAAAQKTAIHAGTPTLSHFDSLGRSFLVIKHNKFKLSSAPAADPPVEEVHRTNVLFDIEGNHREVTDAKDRVVAVYDYDMIANRIHHASMEAGERWLLNNVARKLLYSWNSRGHQFRNTYDPLHRPAESYLREDMGTELLVGRAIYGEAWPNPELNNLRGQLVQTFDQAGTVLTDDYDFKGNLLRTTRQLAREYKTTLDWSLAVSLEGQDFIQLTGFDAVNRPTELTTPDQSLIRLRYNERSQLERVESNLRGSADSTIFVDHIAYDAEGRRTQIEYGNGVTTTHVYDALTSRLSHLLTRRGVAFDDCPQPPPVGWPGCQVQNLHYTYDPAGNLTHIADDAQQTIYFRNKRVEPSTDYVYDSLYRLIEATGREHLGQTGGQANPPTAPDAFNAFHTRLDHPQDGNAMGNYIEQYEYDAVGNILTMLHRGTDPSHPGWTRNYVYNETSQLEGPNVSNRLSSTNLGALTETYEYTGSAGLHGNITRMPHLPLIRWDHRDQLQATSRQVVNNGTPETTWYVYDSLGQRVRKVTERQADVGQTPTRMKERVYLDGFEMYREYGADGNSVELERETLHLMDGEERIALVETRTQGTDPALPQLIRYQFANHVGSASLELDADAQIIAYEEYFPYGSTSYQAVRSQTDTPRRYRYTGKERDEESGFQYHRVRYYLPWLGRWLSPDPIGIADDVNLYLYARSAPTVFIDDLGYQPKKDKKKQPKEQPKQPSKKEPANQTPKKAQSKQAKPDPKKALQEQIKKDNAARAKQMKEDEEVLLELRQDEEIQNAIGEAAELTGIDEDSLEMLIIVESRGKMSATTGTYHGLMQMGKAAFEEVKKSKDTKEEFKGLTVTGKDKKERAITWDDVKTNARANILVGALYAKMNLEKIKRHNERVQAEFDTLLQQSGGMPPTDFHESIDPEIPESTQSMYLAHQQGFGGLRGIYKSPENTIEPNQSGNMPLFDKHKFTRKGEGNKVTKGEFVQSWNERFNRLQKIFNRNPAVP